MEFEAILGSSDSLRYFIANSFACINMPRHSIKNGNPRQFQTRRFSFLGEPTILEDPASLAHIYIIAKDPKLSAQGGSALGGQDQSSYFSEEKTTKGRKPKSI